jgi:predicted KAP-like P-loop ATPase
MEIFENPFAVDINNMPSVLQINVIDLQCDTTLKIVFKEKTNLVDFYGSLPSENYKELKRFAQEMINMFGSIYICEQTFSILNYRKNKHCSRLSDSHLEAILRLSTKKMHANVKKLATKMQQQKSH